jgi:rod shape determining protein RodA
MIVGERRMGAQRWLNLKVFSFQPSEIMRGFIILALARYFSDRTTLEIRYTLHIVIPLILLLVPIVLVILQPDLGTAMLFVFVGAAMFFVCGVQPWKFVIVSAVAAVSAPIAWSFLHDYQKNRILTFFSPEKDPSGAGYHIIQSQIALGSGGFWGKGLMRGSQCQLNFLPEKQTDFVFAALGEELGFVGGSILIVLYTILITYNMSVAIRQTDKFSRILVFGLNSMLSFYVFINIAMVCGLAPVVGIPLPFFSYGGSSLMMLMFSQGLIFACAIEQKKQSRFLC